MSVSFMVKVTHGDEMRTRIETYWQYGSEHVQEHAAIIMAFIR